MRMSKTYLIQVILERNGVRSEIVSQVAFDSFTQDDRNQLSSRDPGKSMTIPIVDDDLTVEGEIFFKVVDVLSIQITG